MSGDIVSKPKPAEKRAKHVPAVADTDEGLDLDFAALPDKQQAQQPVHPGIRLRKAREVRGLHQKDIANWLKLDLKLIDALEKGDETRLPGSVFTSGYIRSYAKLVELSPTTLVDDYQRTLKGSLQKKESSYVPRFVGKPRGLDYLLKQLSIWEIFKEKDAEGRTVRYAALGVVMVVVMVIVVIVLGVRTDDNAVVVVENQATSDDPRTTGESVPVAQTTSQLELPAAASDKPSAVTDVPLRERSEQVADMPLVPLQSGQPRNKNVSTSHGYIVKPLSVGQMDLAGVQDSQSESSAEQLPAQAIQADLALHFRSDSWVDIRDATGKPILRSLGVAGATKEVRGIAPFKILIGYGPGVDLEYNGQAVDFSAQQTRTVARFTLDAE